MFEHISAAPVDPILGLTDALNADTRAQKINLGVGVYKDEQGLTPILPSVKQAEANLLETESSKGYLSITGAAAYGNAVQQLLFGSESSLLKDKRAFTAQVPGGTGALRIASEFLVKHAGVKTIWISNPTWANHNKVFAAAGLEVKSYRYYDSKNMCLDFDAMREDLKNIPSSDVVLLHGCCHNPTGVDPSNQQWQEISDIAQKQGWLALFDFAYQGFAKGIEEDAFGLRLFSQSANELIVCNSFSKNFGLYNERVGGLTVVGGTSQQAADAFSQVKSEIRGIYSNPPAHGALIVTQILENSTLRAQWEDEVAQMRDRIHGMRALFVETLKAKGATQNFDFIIQQNGMFSFSGLTVGQVTRLKEEFAIYAVNSGRINVAGMTKENMDQLCEAVVAVL